MKSDTEVTNGAFPKLEGTALSPYHLLVCISELCMFEDTVVRSAV